jgi:hypothetical protein
MTKRVILLVTVILLFVPASSVIGQDISARKGEISSQVDGQVIFGIVPVEGNTLVEGFLSWELNYGFADDTTGTWFLIAESDEPIADGLLAEWDTTQITDGDYNLRLTLFLEEGRRSHNTVRGLRVRNYSPIETDTPEPTLTSTPFTVTPLPSNTPSPTQIPTATAIPPTITPLPTNSLELDPTALSNSMMRGAAGVLAMFIVIGLYTSIKKTLSR